VIHHRKRIRDRIVEKLKAANIAGVNQNVQGSVFFPFAVKDLPGLCVYATEEQSARVANQYDRTLAIVVKVLCAAALNVEDVIDEICADVELAIPLELDELTNMGALRATAFERSGEGDEELMSAELTYVFTYATSLYNPTAAVH
jgi:hypothetical protein